MKDKVVHPRPRVGAGSRELLVSGVHASCCLSYRLLRKYYATACGESVLLARLLV
jgi:hypothetical protein